MSSAPEADRDGSLHSGRTLRAIVAVILAVPMFLSAYLMTISGVYGIFLFMSLPVFAGALAVFAFQPSSRGMAGLIGGAAGLLAPFLFLLLGWEGAICVFMTWPISFPLASLGGFLVYEGSSRKLGRRGMAMLLLVPSSSLAWDITATSPLFEVRTAIEISAPPEEVWRNVVTFSNLPEPDEWFFKAGLAYPMRARIDGSGPGAIRYCEFSTGPFVEPIEVWDEPRLLSFRVTHNPPPMEEWSPYKKVTPPHLHGYLVSEKGQFRLTALDGGRTLLEGTTWYRHGLFPAEYWRWWSDAIIHRIHLRVLNHIRTLSEQA